MKCPNCNFEFELKENEEVKFCPNCGYPLRPPQEEQISPNAGEQPETVPVYEVPWEDRKHYSYLNGFLQTFKESLFNPTEFFKKMPPKGDGFMPILYAVLWILIVYVINLGINQLLGLNTANFELYEKYFGMKFPYDQNYIQRLMWIQLLMLPVLRIISILIIAGIVHLFALIFKAGGNGFIATLRVIGYAQGVVIFNIIPFLGGFISFLYAIVLYIIGLQHAHKTTGGKAAATVLAPIIFCCVCLVFFIAFFATAVAKSMMVH